MRLALPILQARIKVWQKDDGASSALAADDAPAARSRWRVGWQQRLLFPKQRALDACESGINLAIRGQRSQAPENSSVDEEPVDKVVRAYADALRRHLATQSEESGGEGQPLQPTAAPGAAAPASRAEARNGLRPWDSAGLLPAVDTASAKSDADEVQEEEGRAP